MLVLTLLLSFAQAQDYRALEKRIIDLEKRVLLLEGKKSGGLRKVDYGNQNLEPSKASPEMDPKKMEEINKQLQQYKKQLDERNKYLEELMQEQ
jgi:tetrahydromethanopterin S-methyltransferase subunit G